MIHCDIGYYLYVIFKDNELSKLIDKYETTFLFLRVNYIAGRTTSGFHTAEVACKPWPKPMVTRMALYNHRFSQKKTIATPTICSHKKTHLIHLPFFTQMETHFFIVSVSTIKIATRVIFNLNIMHYSE